MKILKYPGHSTVSAGIICTPRAMEIMKKRPDNDKPCPLEVWNELKEELESMIAILNALIEEEGHDQRDYSFLSQLKKRNLSFKPVLEERKEDGILCVIFANEELWGWEETAILEAVKENLDIEVEYVEYSTDPRHKIWQAFVQD